MPAITQPAALVEAFEEVWRSIDDLCSQLDEEQWKRPTECPGWSVQDNLSHLIGIEAMLLGRSPAPGVPTADHVRNPVGEMNENEVALRRSRPGAEVLAEWREVTSGRMAELATMTEADFAKETMGPMGKTTYAGFMEIRLLDCWTHEQDIRRAVGVPGHLSGPVAEHCLDRVKSAMPFVVGKKAGAPDGSTVVFDVTGPTADTFAVAVEGGRARLLPDGEVPADPTVRITADFVAFMAAALGRCPAGPGDVTLEGDTALGQRIGDNVAFMI